MLVAGLAFAAGYLSAQLVRRVTEARERRRGWRI